MIVKSMSPIDEKLPQNFYRAKVMINALGMRYKKIDACPNHCMYFKDQENNISCPSCGHPWFKPKTRGNGSTRSKKVSYKSLCYFPITPRFQ
jgi:ribosomal protein S27E